MRAVMRAASVLSEMGSLLLVVGVALGVAPGGHYMVTPFPTVSVWRRRRRHLHFLLLSRAAVVSGVKPR